jgi:hypothetical protein
MTKRKRAEQIKVAMYTCKFQALLLCESSFSQVEEFALKHKALIDNSVCYESYDSVWRHFCTWSRHRSREHIVLVAQFLTDTNAAMTGKDVNYLFANLRLSIPAYKNWLIDCNLGSKIDYLTVGQEEFKLECWFDMLTTEELELIPPLSSQMVFKILKTVQDYLSLPHTYEMTIEYVAKVTSLLKDDTDVYFVSECAQKRCANKRQQDWFRTTNICTYYDSSVVLAWSLDINQHRAEQHQIVMEYFKGVYGMSAVSFIINEYNSAPTTFHSCKKK